MDLAKSIQEVIEEVILKLVKTTKKITNSDNLVLAGGVALNCVANSKIIKQNKFRNVWVQPASGDAGSSIGSALLANYEYFNEKRRKSSWRGRNCASWESSRSPTTSHLKSILSRQ